MADEIPSWVTAATGLATFVALAVNFIVIRPMIAKISAQQEELKEQRSRVDKIDDAQQKRLEGVKSDSTRLLEDLNARMKTHEDFDSERFDDLGERLDSKLMGLRREIIEGHTAAVASIKSDQNSAINSVRDDIRELGRRFDGLMNSIAQIGGPRVRGAPGDD